LVIFLGLIVVLHQVANIHIYSQTCLMWHFKGTLKWGHRRQVVTNTGVINMKCTVKLKLRSHNIMQIIA